MKRPLLFTAGLLCYMLCFAQQAAAESSRASSLARPEDFAGLNEVYAKFFPTDPPTRSVARLGPDLGELLVSIKMTAVITQ